MYLVLVTSFCFFELSFQFIFYTHMGVCLNDKIFLAEIIITCFMSTFS